MAISTESGFDVLARINELRKLYGDMSVYKLSKLSDISQSTISTWYSKDIYPPIDKLERICHVFNITLAEFFHLEEDSPDPITTEELQLIKKFHRLSSYHRKLLDELAGVLEKAGEGDEK
jgi:transcriptional regulator with XRE-family HTH domain